MMRTSRFVAVSCVLSITLLFGISAQAADSTPRFTLTLRGWFTSANVRSGLVEELFTNSSDAIRKMNLGDEVALEGRARLGIAARHALELRYLYFAKSDNFTAYHGTQWGGTQSGDVKNSVDVSYARLGWHWAVIEPENGAFRLETIVDVSGGEIKQSGKLHRMAWPLPPVTSADANVSGVWPTIGLAAKVSPTKWFDLFGEVSGMTGITDVDVLDWEAGLRVNPFNWLGIEAGYRSLEINGTDHNTDVRVSFSGPFIGTELRF